MNARPNILSMPNIPKPLHGLNPRSIMGARWWNDERSKVYSSTNFTCAACGVHKIDAKKHKWLEAHEIFDIDYKKQTATMVGIVPLCHFCHAFIHSGLTRIRARRKLICANDVRDIMSHGCEVLRRGKCDIFAGTHDLCRLVGVDTSGIAVSSIKDIGANWGGWRMIWNGVEYDARFKSMREWQRFYS